MKKKRRMGQASAKQKEQKEAANGGVLGVSDCDLGASPQMNKNSLLANYKKQPLGKMSPLGVQARQFQLNQQ